MFEGRQRCEVSFGISFEGVIGRGVSFELRFEGEGACSKVRSKFIKGKFLN